MNTLLARYEHNLAKNKINADTKQQEIVFYLDNLCKKLTENYNFDKTILGRFYTFIHFNPHKVRGLYIWGDVGRGKTFLMNLFYNSLPFKNKLRLHFHHFMRQIHEQLKLSQGKKNPLEYIVNAMLKKIRVLCLDEFMVTDITDAMLLATFLKHLFKSGITLIATSNTPPDKLYQNGLQYYRFFPAIQLIKNHTKIAHLDNGVDYRMQLLLKENLYLSPLNKVTKNHLKKNFLQLCGHKRVQERTNFAIAGRVIKTVRICEDMGWLTFDELCVKPCGRSDYITLAKRFKTLFLTDIKQLNPNMSECTTRFIHLIDILYDNNINVIMSCEVPIDELYQGTPKPTSLARTLSRMHEMQTEKYIEKSYKKYRETVHSS